MYRAFTVFGIVTLMLIGATFGVGAYVGRGHPSLSPNAVTAHMLLGFLTAIVIAFHKCAVFWHFIGSGIEIKHLTADHGLPHDFYNQSWQYKMRLLPIVLISPLIFIAAVVLAGAFLGGATANKALHWQVGLGAGFINTVSVILESIYLKKNAQTIAEVNALLHDPKYREPLPSKDWDAKGVDPARDAARPEAQASVGRALLTLGLLIWMPYFYFHFLVPDQSGGSHFWLLLICSLVSVVALGFSVALLLRGRARPATGGTGTTAG